MGEPLVGAEGLPKEDKVQGHIVTMLPWAWEEGEGAAQSQDSAVDCAEGGEHWQKKWQ